MKETRVARFKDFLFSFDLLFNEPIIIHTDFRGIMGIQHLCTSITYVRH